jgi:virginiamycin B lyase
MSRKVKKSRKVNKFVIIGIAAALVASTLAVVYRPSDPRQDEAKALFCGSGVANSNRYIQEFVIPTECSEPVGITVDSDGIVWFAESAKRKIGKFDPAARKFEEYALPDAKEQEKAMPVASIWSMKFDDQGNLWFPDVLANAIWKFDPNTARFETYKILTTTDFGTSYPINFEFDKNGKIWFSEIYGKNIGVLDPSKVQHNTNDGISEISARVDLETIGPLAFDNDGNIWFTALTYPATGRLMKFEPEKKVFTTFNMPGGISSPIGIAPDKDGNLWINDHGTSAFIKFNPSTNTTTTYVTSLPTRNTSIGGYEKCLTQPYGSSITCPGLPVSLPYWNTVDSQGRIWFNEHQGNSIAVFDPAIETLIEYFVPTQNSRWAACEEYTEPCGIANPLQFTVAPQGKVWFTEWSENKIGKLDPDLSLPISLEIVTNDKQNTVSHGETLTLDIAVTANEKLNSNVQMRISGTIVPAGRLFNMTAEFSEEELAFNEPTTKNITLKLTPEDGLEPGDYKITISARYNEVTYSKIIELTVVPGKI